MGYTKKQWKDYPSAETLVTAFDLNHMEDGIYNAEEKAQQALDDMPTVSDTYSATSEDAMSGKAVAEAVSGVQTGANEIEYDKATSTLKLKKDGTELDSATIDVGTDVSVTQIQSAGVHIADIEVDGSKTEIYAPNSGGSTVSVTQIESTGTHIADIEVDGNKTEIYAPEGGGAAIEYMEQQAYDDAKAAGTLDEDEYYATPGASSITLPFRFGIDEDGNYGYYKVGADSVTPFKSGEPVDITVDEAQKQVDATAGRTAAFSRSITLTTGTWIVSAIVSASGGKFAATTASNPYAPTSQFDITFDSTCEMVALSEDNGAGYGSSYATYASQHVIKCNVTEDSCVLNVSFKAGSTSTSYGSLYHIVPIKISDGQV